MHAPGVAGCNPVGHPQLHLHKRVWGSQIASYLISSHRVNTSRYAPYQANLSIIVTR